MQLSQRLTAIAGMVTEGNRLVDVGCDHGYLPVYLIQNQKIPSAIAMDVGRGPLRRAKEHIRQYGLCPYIDTRLSDGLKALKKGEGDTLVLAGMGGPLMERILTEGREVREGFSEMILQPQSHVPHFRRFIREEGWEIVQEEMILEGGKFYPMMKVIPMEKKKGEKVRALPPCEEAFGPFLLEKKHLVLRQYLLRERNIREKILEHLSQEEGDGAKSRIKEVKEEQRLIMAALAYYED